MQLFKINSSFIRSPKASEWSLRLGLGLMFVYSSVDILRHPTAWFWAVRPIFRWFPASMQADLIKPETMTTFLRAHAAWELFLVFGLLGWFLPRKFVQLIAGLTVLEMAGILLLLPIDAITFRDIGLLGAGMALFLLLGYESDRQLSGMARSGQSTPENPLRDGPVVKTFDEFIGKK